MVSKFMKSAHPHIKTSMNDRFHALNQQNRSICQSNAGESPELGIRVSCRQDGSLNNPRGKQRDTL